MLITDAAQILDLSGTVTADDVKKAYRKACTKYHPDRNPAGVEMMQAVNAAYEVLKGYEGDVGKATEYGDELSQAIEFLKGLAGIEIEVCGAWLWLSGNTKANKEALKAAKDHLLNGNGFKWAPKKKRWYFRPAEWRSSSRGGVSMDEIRERHGSKWVKGNGGPAKIAANS